MKLKDFFNKAKRPALNAVGMAFSPTITTAAKMLSGSYRKPSGGQQKPQQAIDERLVDGKLKTTYREMENPYDFGMSYQPESVQNQPQSQIPGQTVGGQGDSDFSSGQLFQGGSSIQGGGSQEYQSKYINPATGERYDPNEYSEMVVNKMNSGAVGSLAGDQFRGDQSTEDIMQTAREAANARNDIASGETDPYGVGADSGIAYTPAEMKAIESAQAGVYDPALQNVFSRLEASQASDAEQAGIRSEERQQQYKKDLMDYEEGYTGGDSMNRYSGGDTGGDYEFSQEARNLVSLLQTKKIKPSDIKDENLRDEALLYWSQNASDGTASNLVRGASGVVRDAQTAIDLINESDSFNDTNTGIIAANKRFIRSKIKGSSEWEAAQAIQSVKDNIGIDALLNIKREGSGLGQVPQSQLESLQGLLGRLDVARDPKLLKRDLGDALGLYQDIVDAAGGSVLRSAQPEYEGNSGLSQEEASEFESIYGYNPLAFSNVGNTRDSGNSRGLINRANADAYSNNNRGSYNPNVSFASKEIAPSSDLATAMQSIANIESRGSGGYSARGPVVTKGMYKGERALGRYQVMPGNLKQWGTAAIGRPVTEQEFINNPELQDKIVAVQFIKNYQKYGNWGDAASIWFTGKPMSKGGGAKDDLGTSGNQYVSNFTREYNKLA